MIAVQEFVGSLAMVFSAAALRECFLTSRTDPLNSVENIVTAAPSAS
jgi:hypothetical protein